MQKQCTNWQIINNTNAIAWTQKIFELNLFIKIDLGLCFADVQLGVFKESLNYDIMIVYWFSIYLKRYNKGPKWNNVRYSIWFAF